MARWHGLATRHFDRNVRKLLQNHHHTNDGVRERKKEPTVSNTPEYMVLKVLKVWKMASWPQKIKKDHTIV